MTGTQSAPNIPVPTQRKKQVIPTTSPQPPVIREYYIGDTKYIVTATVKTGADEDAVTKVRRLIRNEISRQAEN
jgi:hypothetical protein